MTIELKLNMHDVFPTPLKICQIKLHLATQRLAFFAMNMLTERC